MASFFKQLSDDMEKVIQTVEEGAKFMMGETAYLGEKKNDAESSFTTTLYNDGGDSDGDAIFDELGDKIDGIDELDGGSPLMGMADSVLSDIMSMQVGSLYLYLDKQNCLPVPNFFLLHSFSDWSTNNEGTYPCIHISHYVG